MLKGFLAIGAVLLCACGRDVAGPVDARTEPNQQTLAAKSGSGGSSSTLYKFRLITGVNPAGDGELQSGWFPDAGYALDTKSPWRSVSVSNVQIDLVNYTHGDWTAGQCAVLVANATYQINQTNWDIAGTNPLLSFAGTWQGSISISDGLAGHDSFGFDGDRVVNGVVTPSAGGIHNVLSQSNVAIETKDSTGNNDWFRIEFRNAYLKFGSKSTADGVTIVPGAEVACGNFTIEARKASLITP